MRLRFTDRSIRALKPREKRYQATAEGESGFFVFVAPDGAKSSGIQWRLKGKLSRHVFGRFGGDRSKSRLELHSSRL